MTVVLDTGALIAHERGARRMELLLEGADQESREIWVPAVVVAQFWRDGSRQVLLARLLAGAIVDPVDDEPARRAGELLGRTGTPDVVDGIVACIAARERATIITSDPDDLQRLADELGDVRVLSV